MSNKGDLELYTFRELSEKVEKERIERLQNGLSDGGFKVYFQKSNLTIQIECNGREWYEIDLECCNNSDELLEWIFHIHGKTWGNSGGLLAAILTILDDACHEVFARGSKTLFERGETINWNNPQQ